MMQSRLEDGRGRPAGGKGDEESQMMRKARFRLRINEEIREADIVVGTKAQWESSSLAATPGWSVSITLCPESLVTSSLRFFLAFSNSRLSNFSNSSCILSYRSMNPRGDRRTMT